MTEKRFWSEDYSVGYYTEIVDNEKEFEDVPNSKKNLTIAEVVDTLNELYEEKEDWKNKCLNNASENSILWNEISILREQGAEPSSAFQQYLDSISTEYDKFWQRKLKKARKDRVI